MPVDTLLHHFASGHRAIMVTGRSLWDLHLDDQGQVRPLRHTLFRHARERHQMAALGFNLAQGAVWELVGQPPQERRRIEADLRAVGIDIALLAGDQAGGRLPHERALALLSAIHTAAITRESIPPLLLVLDFTEHLAPNASAQATDFTLQLTEMLWILAHEVRLRRHSLFIVFCGCRDLVATGVTSTLPEIRLQQPDKAEKLPFIAALRASELRQAAVFEPGLDDDAVAALSAHTPNRSLEQLCYGSSRTGQAITRDQLVDRKRDDIVAMSDGTLRLLDTGRVAMSRLNGRCINHVVGILTGWSARLRAGDTRMPMNILLAGAPSTGKTDVALSLARLAGVPALEMASPKGSFVGETERRSKLQWRVFKELAPAMGFVDEVTETWGLRRGGMNLDSGASDAMQGAMLEALSDSSRAGRTLLVATTNCPWRLGAAQESRWACLPVLAALPEDYPDIVAGIASTVEPSMAWSPDDPLIIAAADVFVEKALPPRGIRSALTVEASLAPGVLTPGRVLNAARAALPPSQKARLSAEYADLAAIARCSSRTFLPWFADPQGYPFPACLRGIVDASTGEVDGDALDARLHLLADQIDV
ncbi:MAG TPA: ATP-binding protein [Prosthecobacter sp.]